MASEKSPGIDDPVASAAAEAQTPKSEAEVAQRSEDGDAKPVAETSQAEPSASEPGDGAPSSPAESGEASSPSPSPSGQNDTKKSEDVAPLPSEAPPLPNDPPPSADNDGWDFHWDETNQAFFFHNRITGVTTWENPRTAAPPSASLQDGAPGTAGPSASASGPPPLPTSSRPAAGGYNPAIHGDYDPNAWYAKGGEDESEEASSASAAYLASIGQPEGTAASFNRFTGQFQRPGDNPDRHSDAAKSHRQMNAFFDVDAAANAHDGRSLKAERSGKKISKAELKQFKEKRKARKEEKRRAWLRD